MDSQVQKRGNPARRLTRKGEATRARIVDGAAAEFRRRGVADTTLDHVIELTETGKGQLFHYFPGGREELLIAVAEREAARVLTDQEPHLGRLATRADWEAWRAAVVDRYRRQGDECPLSMLVSQIGRNSPAGRAVTAALLRDWEAELAAGLRRTQESGEIDATHDPDRTAAAIVAAIQGGVVVLLATGEIGHLEAALDLVLAHLFEPATAAA
jgi:AcrR family transcriptional regulator